jgi:hypothetical protein
MARRDMGDAAIGQPPLELDRVNAGHPEGVGHSVFGKEGRQILTEGPHPVRSCRQPLAANTAAAIAMS